MQRDIDMGVKIVLLKGWFLLLLLLPLLSSALDMSLVFEREVEITDDQVFMNEAFAEIKAEFEEEGMTDHITYQDPLVQYAPDKSFRVFTFPYSIHEGHTYPHELHMIYTRDQRLYSVEGLYGEIDQIHSIAGKDGPVYLLINAHAGETELRAEISNTCISVSLLAFRETELEVQEVFERESWFADCIPYEGFHTLVACGDDISAFPVLEYHPEEQTLTFSTAIYDDKEIIDTKEYFLNRGAFKWNGEYFDLLWQEKELKKSDL